MKNIPETIPSSLSDRILMSWEDALLGDMVIQMEMQFEGELDAPRLERALDLVLDAQPVLGCRADKTPKRLLWQRLHGDERKNLFVTCLENEYEAFRILPADCTNGPQLKACLLRAGGRDRLLLKFAHQVADAGGVKEATEDVAAIYTRLGKDPAYRPEPNISGSREWDQIHRVVPVSAYPKVLLNYLRESRSMVMPFKSRMLPLPDGPVSPIYYSLRHFPKENVAALSKYARERGATLNDMLATAYIRANSAMCGPDARGNVRLHMTIDLRRWYLGDDRAGGICNLSTFEYIDIGRDPGRDFDETLTRVNKFMSERKTNWPGLNWSVYLPYLYATNYKGVLDFFGISMGYMKKKGNFPNLLTNMGPITPEKATFGDMAPQTAWLLVPPLYPPCFGAGLSGYDGTLTISAGVPAHAKQTAEDFFDKVVEELPA